MRGLVSLDFIEQSVAMNEEFADGGVFEFRYNATAFRKGAEAFGLFEDFFQKGKSRGRRVFRDVSNDVVEVGSRSWGPDYFPPLCHLCLSSRFTSSWLSIFPCAMSCLPRSMVCKT